MMPSPDFEQDLLDYLFAPPWRGARHCKRFDFYSEQAGFVVAERFLEEFERVAKLLVEHPASERQRREDEEHSR